MMLCVEMIPLHYCWGCITFQTASHIHEIHHITHTMWLSTMICCPLVYISSLVTQFYPHYLDQFWGSGSLVMMWLCHGWGRQASPIHIRHIQSVWAHWYHWYAVHWHTAAAFLHSYYTHPRQLRFWGSGSLVESKWCQHVVVWRFCSSCQCALPLKWRGGPPLLHMHRQVLGCQLLQ